MLLKRVDVEGSSNQRKGIGFRRKMRTNRHLVLLSSINTPQGPRVALSNVQKSHYRCRTRYADEVTQELPPPPTRKNSFVEGCGCAKQGPLILTLMVWYGRSRWRRRAIARRQGKGAGRGLITIDMNIGARRRL
jgi:hypothetical protein